MEGERSNVNDGSPGTKRDEPVGTSQSVPERPQASASPEKDRFGNSLGRWKVTTSEAAAAALTAYPHEAAPAEGDRAGRRVEIARAPADDDPIVFPRFEPTAEFDDDNVAASPARAPGVLFKSPPNQAPAEQPRSIRRTRSRLRSILLLALVVVLAGPAFLWLRDRFDASGLNILNTVARSDSLSRPKDAASVAPTPESSTAAPNIGASSRPIEAPSAVPTQPKPAPPAGLLVVTAPGRMQIYENGRLIGATGGEPIKLPAGTHTLEFVSEELGYRETQRVTVQASQTVRVRLNRPEGSTQH